MEKDIARAVRVELEDQTLIALEIPQEVIEKFALAENQLIECHVDTDNQTLTLKKLNLIKNG